MLPILLVIISLISLIALWLMTTQRELVLLDENTNNALSQISVQLSSRFDALMALLDLTRVYNNNESEAITEIIRSERRVVTAKSTPDEVIRQEQIISEVLVRLSLVSNQYPELIANPYYTKTMDAVQAYENMIRASKLVYNDSVTKLNRQIRMFPVAMVGGLLGFSQRDYLEDQKAKTEIQEEFDVKKKPLLRI